MTPRTTGMVWIYPSEGEKNPPGISLVGTLLEINIENDLQETFDGEGVRCYVPTGGRIVTVIVHQEKEDQKEDPMPILYELAEAAEEILNRWRVQYQNTLRSSDGMKTPLVQLFGMLASLVGEVWALRNRLMGHMG